jgi:hypothetical protein
MKAGGPEAMKCMRYIIKATIRYGRVMHSWKETRTVLIYTKGDREDLKNWRPITITNYIYRIDMSLMARAFPQINFQHALYVDISKRFIKKTKGCSEHGILLNEPFQDAKRNYEKTGIECLILVTIAEAVPCILAQLKTADGEYVFNTVQLDHGRRWGSHGCRSEANGSLVRLCKAKTAKSGE